MEKRVSYQRKKRLKRRRSNIFLGLMLCLCLCIFIFCILKVFVWDQENNKASKIKDDVTKDVVERVAIKDKTTNVNPPTDKTDDYFDYIKMDMMSANFKALKKKNIDTVGFIKVNGTNINYPVVQTTDNDFYLNHAFDRSKNSAGWVFADYRNNMMDFDRNTIIYAHGRLNNTMFGSLKNIVNSSWYDNKNNYIVKFSTPYENTLWRVFSVYTVPAESYYITTNFKTDNDYKSFLDTITRRSKKDFNTTVDINDKVLTLSTCKDVAGKERVVMHAKMIKIEKRG